MGALTKFKPFSLGRVKIIIMDVPCAYVNCLLLNNPTIRDVYAKDVYFFLIYT